MIICYTDCETAILFVDTETGTFQHFKASEIAPGRNEEQLQTALDKIFKEHPGYEAAYQDHQVLEAFCHCGNYAFEYVSGKLTCSECGDPYPGGDYPTLLVPELLVGKVPRKKPEGVTDAEPEEVKEVLVQEGPHESGG